jgi:spore maturation protein CgeB
LVSYLPFAYAPELHYPEPPDTAAELDRFACDLVFVGGADVDRVPFLGAVIRSGLDVRLYGHYWDRFPTTRAYALGPADPGTVRRAVGAGRVALCLVRRANRDGHAMRSFEVPAIGACMLVEETDEHLELFGPSGEAVVTFRTAGEMIERLDWLLTHESERRRLASTAHSMITRGHHTYADRLAAMLEAA